MDNKQIRQEARYLLKGKWIKLSIIYLLFFTFFSYVNNAPTMLNTSSTALTLGMAILGLILTIFLVPFFYGLIDVMVRSARGEKVRLFEFVSVGLKNFKNAYFLVFFTIINLAIPILTFVFTAFITDWANRNGNSFLTVTFGILYLISTFFLFARFFYYVIGIFVMIDNKDKNVKQILDESKEIMSMERLNLLKLFAHFIIIIAIIAAISSTVAIAINPEHPLVLVILYAGAALMFPYIQISMYVFYEYHKDPHYKYKYEEHMKEIETKKETKEKNQESKKENNDPITDGKKKKKKK